MDASGQTPVGNDKHQQMEAIMTAHETALLRYATRILRNPTAAEDVVQNVFIKLFRGWEEGLQPSAHLSSWLYRVTHNEAVDYIRRESRLQVLHEKQAEGQPDLCPDGIHCSPEEARRQEVLGQLNRLGEAEQQVLLLRLEQGFSYRDISRITGRSEGNVGNLLHHAVKKLSASLKKAGVVKS
jgi:RNA polymerase sigma factor (sigma-70 family)